MMRTVADASPGNCQALQDDLMAEIDEIEFEEQVRNLGREIFEEVQSGGYGLFDAEYYIGPLLDWAMADERFKTSLFRFIDVLPSLATRESIVRHAQEYFTESMERIPKGLRWGLNLPPSSLIARFGAEVVKRQIRSLAHRFIIGQSPAKALSRLKQLRRSGVAFTVDLLGEAALSEEESAAYVERYLSLLTELGSASFHALGSVPAGHWGEASPLNISVKLSALFSQTRPVSFASSVTAISSRLAEIMSKARELGAFVYVDMEDSSLTSITLETFKQVMSREEFRDYDRCGIVIQAYLKRSDADLTDLIEWGRKRNTPFSVRFVKVGPFVDNYRVLPAHLSDDSLHMS